MSDFAVVVTAAPQQRHVEVRLAGDLDADARPALDDAVAQVAALSPERVVVDLDQVAFADSTLTHFLESIVAVLPHATPVTVCRAKPMHRWVLEVTGMAHILTITSQTGTPASTLEDAGRAVR